MARKNCWDFLHGQSHTVSPRKTTFPSLQGSAETVRKKLSPPARATANIKSCREISNSPWSHIMSSRASHLPWCGLFTRRHQKKAFHPLHSLRMSSAKVLSLHVDTDLVSSRKVVFLGAIAHQVSSGERSLVTTCMTSSGNQFSPLTKMRSQDIIREEFFPLMREDSVQVVTRLTHLGVILIEGLTVDPDELHVIGHFTARLVAETHRNTNVTHAFVNITNPLVGSFVRWMDLVLCHVSNHSLMMMG